MYIWKFRQKIFYKKMTFEKTSKETGEIGQLRISGKNFLETVYRKPRCVWSFSLGTVQKNI